MLRRYSKHDKRIVAVLNDRANKAEEQEEEFSMIAPFALFGGCLVEAIAWIIRHS